MDWIQGVKREESTVTPRFLVYATEQFFFGREGRCHSWHPGGSLKHGFGAQKLEI